MVLFDSKIEVNTIQPTFAKKLGFSIRSIDVKAWKIDGTMLDIYEIVVAVFLITDQANQIRFFEKTFLIGNIILKVIFGIFFFFLSDANIDFLD